MKHIAYQTLEELMNQGLRLDPETHHELTQLAGRLVALHITDWDVEWVLEITPEGVIFRRDSPLDIDATISGPLFGIIQTACQSDRASAMREAGLKLRGDIHLAEQLKDILERLNLDWEGALARFVGESTAGGIGMGLRRFAEFAQQSLESGTKQLATYLKTDSACLPSPAEVLQFNRSVSVLRHDVDRLAARVAALTHLASEDNE